MQIQIPNPCLEDWAEMSPRTDGRHCNKCAKTVTDFTEMSPAEISLYLQLQSGARVCGRFREDQLNTELPDAEVFLHAIARKPWPLVKQLAALLLFVFLICGNPAEAQQRPGTAPKAAPVTLRGEAMQQDRTHPETSKPGKSPVGDTAVPKPPVRMGKIAAPRACEKKPPLFEQPANRYFTGFVSMPPPKK